MKIIHTHTCTKPGTILNLFSIVLGCTIPSWLNIYILFRIVIQNSFRNSGGKSVFMFCCHIFRLYSCWSILRLDFEYLNTQALSNVRFQWSFANKLSSLVLQSSSVSRDTNWTFSLNMEKSIFFYFLFVFGFYPSEIITNKDNKMLNGKLAIANCPFKSVLRSVIASFKCLTSY